MYSVIMNIYMDKKDKFVVLKFKLSILSHVGKQFKANEQIKQILFDISACMYSSIY
jgi:hypothetical protein